MLNGGNDWVQCTEYALYTVIAAVLIILYSMLLFLQFKKYGIKSREVFKRTMTWVLINAIVLLSLILVDNILEPSGMIWAMSALIQCLIVFFRQTTALLLFDYFRKRSAKLMGREEAMSLERIRVLMIFVTVACLLAVIIAFSVKLVHILKAPDIGDAK